jgi:hypothetical protein
MVRLTLWTSFVIWLAAAMLAQTALRMLLTTIRPILEALR